jgi:molybdopterin synthase sulfur carrier subunit
MVTVEFLGPIGREPAEIEAASLEELSVILAEDETLKPWLKNSAVAVNDEMVSNRSHPLKAGDRITLLPPVCGG